MAILIFAKATERYISAGTKAIFVKFCKVLFSTKSSVFDKLLILFDLIWPSTKCKYLSAGYLPPGDTSWRIKESVRSVRLSVTHDISKVRRSSSSIRPSRSISPKLLDSVS